MKVILVHISILVYVCNENGCRVWFGIVWPATTVPPSALGEEKEGRSSGTRD